MITILYFGRLREQLGCHQENLDWEGGTVTALLTFLRSRGEVWSSALAPNQVYRVVVNRSILYGDGDIPPDAEVGILPPVTGG